ncbi:Leucine rich repeat variant [Rubripirellula tenax]|uniref:Leucine rich repeat variant n=1 Tax=Rubripirellula tenax TaxID=2528015 RepID=A0A5C6E4E9_9BACT|nr:HEAT repeat domain-containing protein [Rubripirellula tenax]TWU43700.1 Leucine rich repeat variant [Rubripirellula tenax]
MIESAAEFRELRESDDPERYNRAATENASLATWTAIVQSMPDMRFWVAHNKTVPASVLAALASDPDANVRHMVAQKRKIDPATQRLLASDTDTAVRCALARNAKLVPDVLDMLSHDTGHMVRDAVLQEHQLPAPRLTGE